MEQQHVSEYNISNVFDLHHLIHLNECFNNQKKGRSTALTLSEFNQAIKQVVGTKCLTDEEIQRIFERIDANGDSKVDWDEWLSFFLIFDQNRRNVRQDLAFTQLSTRDSIITSVHFHSKRITRILQTTDSYITGSYDGLIKFWNSKTLTLTATVPLIQRSRSFYEKATSTTGVVDLCLFTDQHLAIALTDSSVCIYEIGKWEQPFCRLNQLKYHPTCLGSCRIDQIPFLLLGDTHGQVLRFRLMSKGRMLRDRKDQIHSNWVTKVSHIESVYAIVSSSNDGNVVMTDVKTGKRLRCFRKHGSGVYAFVYCRKWGFMASAGTSRNILIWNPNTAQVLSCLSNHTASIQDLLLDEPNNNLISISVDKMIIVWDCETFYCKQQIADFTLYSPENAFSAVLWNAELETLLTANTSLTSWALERFGGASCGYSQDRPIMSAIYHPVFHQVVSADNQANLYIWDADTGNLVLRIPSAHPNTLISCMCFDDLGRRFITGAADGSISMWNISNGQKIASFSIDDLSSVNRSTITAVIFVRVGSSPFIAVTGWDRKIHVFNDSAGFQQPQTMQLPNLVSKSTHGHQDDILALCYCPDGFLVSSSCDGTLLIWTKETQSIRYKIELENDAEYLIPLTYPKGVLSAMANGTIMIWSVQSGELLSKMKCDVVGDERISAIFLDPISEKILLIGTSDGRILVHVLEEETVVRFIESWDAHTHSIVYVASGSREETEIVLSASIDKVISIWTMKGDHIGIFGDPVPWSISNRSTWRSKSLGCGKYAKHDRVAFLDREKEKSRHEKIKSKIKIRKKHGAIADDKIWELTAKKLYRSPPKQSQSPRTRRLTEQSKTSPSIYRIQQVPKDHQTFMHRSAQEPTHLAIRRAFSKRIDP